MIILSVFLVLLALPGCATNTNAQKTTTVQTTSTTPVDNAYGDKTVKTVETSTTSEAKPAESTGILGGTVHVLGEIVAFPFKVIAKLFEVIF